MVLLNGKEVSQEDFDKLVTKANSADKIAKGYEDKVKELEEKAKSADSIGDLQKQIELKDAQLFKIKLTERVNKVNKYLETKNNDEKLIKRIGDMSDDDFDFFSEGKTNSDYTTKEELDSAKNDLEKKKTELES